MFRICLSHKKHDEAIDDKTLKILQFSVACWGPNWNGPVHQRPPESDDRNWENPWKSDGDDGDVLFGDFSMVIELIELCNGDLMFNLIVYGDWVLWWA